MSLERALAAVAAASAVVLLALMALLSTLPPCEYEDSTMCYWDAQHRGNHRGESFVNLGFGD